MGKSTEGVILMAFGKANYMYMAAHMAMSIKYFSKNKVKIKLVHDGCLKYVLPKWKAFFDETEEIKKEHIYLDNKLNPGWAKLNVYEYASFNKNIYLDVDGICIQDLTPLFDQEKFYATEVMDIGGRNDKINYSHWATNEMAWKNFGLKKDAQFPTVQSSFAYFKKGREAKAFFTRMKKNFNYPKNDLLHTWGGTMPDELIISGTCAQIGHNPSIKGKAVFFGHKLFKDTFKEIQTKYYINSLYGNGRGNTLVRTKYMDWYNGICKDVASKMGIHPIAKAHRLMKGKHAG